MSGLIRTNIFAIFSGWDCQIFIFPICFPPPVHNIFPPFQPFAMLPESDSDLRYSHKRNLCVNKCQLVVSADPQEILVTHAYQSYWIRLESLVSEFYWQSCGKPSTKFPHRGLVECLSIQ